MVKVEAKPKSGGCVVLNAKHKVRVSYGMTAAGLLYVWVRLKDGRTLSLFVNRETGLVVGDVTEGKNCGNEFIRRNAPPPLSADERAALEALVPESA